MEDKDFELRMINKVKLKEPYFPKFLLADYFEDDETLYIIHTHTPSFILNNETKEIKFLHYMDADEKDSAEVKKLIDNALAWADLELDKYQPEYTEIL